MGTSVLLAFCLLLAGCDAGPGGDAGDRGDRCIDTENLRKGAERGSIEALTNPPIVDADEVDLRDSERVIALLVGDTPLAVPRALLNQHEIVNLDDWLADPITITYCPLTKSSLAFDRGRVEGAPFDVSGLLLHDNLVMVDERSNESLWPQMKRSAVCGPASGTTLAMVPILDLTWGHWRMLHPNTKVLPVSVDETSSKAGQGKKSGRKKWEASSLGERTPSGPVLGLPAASLVGGGKESSTGGMALPFRALNDGQAARVVNIADNGGPVVFWHRAARAAMAYETSDSFSATEDGRFVDEATGSVWTLDGRAVRGPRTGERLTPVRTAHVALWSAWSDIHPDTEVWDDPS